MQRFACSLQKKNRQIGSQMVNYDRLLFHVVFTIVYTDSFNLIIREAMHLQGTVL